MLLIIIFVIIYLLVRMNIDRMYFEPFNDFGFFNSNYFENFNNINEKYKFINKNGHYALFKNGKNKKRVMIIAHGNAGSFLDRKLLIDNLDNYSGDIYAIEYPGFSGLPGTSNIYNCVEEIMFWINLLKPKYKKIDLFGESIGGGLIIETCIKYSLNCINKIYLQSTFSSLKNVIKDLNYNLYILYNILLLDDLNTYENLKKINCNKFVIIHSLNDRLINYEQSLSNYELLKKLNKKVKFIEGEGGHSDTQFKL